MKKLLLTFLALPYLALPSAALAQGIDVTFGSDPLFLQGDIKPGDCYTADFNVENESDQSADGYLRTYKDSQTKGLADALDVTITNTDTSSSVYNGTFGDIFDKNDDSDFIPLETVAAGADNSYEIKTCFPFASGNEYQLGTADFDLCVGFSGGEEQCVAGGGADDGNDGDNGTSTDNGNGAGGGGGFNLLDRDGNGTPDEDDATPDNPEVAGVSTTSPPESNLSGLLSDLEDALRDLLASLREGGAVLGVLDRRPPSLPATGDGSFAGTEGGAKTTATAALFGGILLTLLVLLFASYRWHTTKKVN
jgi:hypothetical protein